MAGPSNRGPSGWASFAGVILFLVGTFSVLYGLAAVLNDDVVTVGGGGGVIVWNFTTWGWIHIVIGAIMVATSLGLFWVRPWARVAAVIFATLSAITQIGLITAFPLWSIMIIALDVLVIYHLTEKGGGEQAAL
jgi:hypothetical protein